MCDQLSKVWPACEQWIKRMYIKREDYHRGTFNGNDSRRLLKNVSVLEEISEPSNLKVQAYVDAFNAFNEVVTACYGKTLAPNYKEEMKKIQESI